MRARSSFVLVLFAQGAVACGSLLGVGDDAPPAAAEADMDAWQPVEDGAAPDVTPSGDGSAPGVRCDVSRPFGPAVPQGWANVGVTAVRFGAGGRVYTSAEDVLGHFLLGGSVTASGIFAASTVFFNADPDRGRDDTQPSVTADELTVFWQSRQDANGRWRLVRAMRASVTDPFGALQSLDPPLGDSRDELQDPYVVGSRVYLTYQPFQQSKRLRVLDLTSVSFEAVPIDSPPNEADHPAVTLDELELFFTAGSGALVHATRASTKGAFTARGQLEAADFDNLKPTWVSPDACRFFAIGTQKLAGTKALLLFTRGEP